MGAAHAASPVRLHETPSVRPLAIRARGEDGAAEPTSSDILLVGTRSAVRALAMQWFQAGQSSAPAGCVLVNAGEADAPDDLLPTVLGSVEDLPRLYERGRFRSAIVSIPRAERASAMRVRALLSGLGVEQRTVPPVSDLVAELSAEVPERDEAPNGGGCTWRPLPAIDLAELIGRRPHDLDEVAISAMLTGRRVLVTGAGGSIGSQIASVCARFAPSELILVERAENALFDIDRRVGERHPGLARRAVLHDIVDEAATRRMVSKAAPDIVFHAAAHKHVPLMEDHPAAALTNNLFGTRSIVDACAAAGVSRFVMISTDKAVRPTSVMGATKRLAERYVRSVAAGQGDGTDAMRLSMVRFGNVLGSACSVLTIWAAQIAEGGAITVTDPRMTRFFMTIPEAATLVIQSAALTEADDLAPVYVLDMGEPVHIVELAERFVRACGLTPRVGTDCVGPAEPGTADILFTGIRPGEKLHEELAYEAEELRPTAHPGIRAWDGRGGEASQTLAPTALADLERARNNPDRDAVLDLIRRHVPEMIRPLPQQKGMESRAGGPAGPGIVR